jgi:DEAD/DEAH box helicase domain-containing protein
VQTNGEPEQGPTIEELDVNPNLRRNFLRLGVSRLYSYQGEVLKLWRGNENIMISSGTGTGKTEAFLLPALDAAAKGERTVLVYPTKALARDQLSRLLTLSEGVAEVGVFDGDTPEKERARLAQSPPQILLTNPDMIHVGLAMSPRFRSIITSADHFVFDEVHVYEGVFGSHLRALTERLRSFSSLHLIAASATVGKPDWTFKSLFGEEGKVVEGMRGRRGSVVHVMISAPNRWTTSALLVSQLVRRGLRTLVFTDSQQMAELVSKIASRLGVSIAVHRAGISAEERLRVEEGLRRGEVQGVASTPTLELGLDIGTLDAVIMAQNPPSFARYMQRAGRAGRREREGYSFVIMGDDPIDSYYLRDPERFYSRELSPLPVDPSNLEVVKVHVVAHLLARPGTSLPKLWVRAAKELVKIGVIKEFNGKFYPTSSSWSYISSSSLRSSGPSVHIIHRGRKIGTRELPLALMELFPGAIYMNAGKTYKVSSLDLSSRRAEVERIGEEIRYTRPLYDVDMVAFTELTRGKAFGLSSIYGEMMVKMTVVGYVLVDPLSQRKEPFGLDDPISYSYSTKGFIIQHPSIMGDPLGDMEAFHATEHSIISAARVVAGSSMTDLSGVSYPSGHVIVYDSAQGGSGVSELLFHRLEDAYSVAKDVLANCDCEDGCPKCVYSPYCGNNNKVLSRKKALRLMNFISSGVEVQQWDRWGRPLA